MTTTSLSPSRRAWQRFRRNRLGYGSLLLFCALVMLSLMGLDPKLAFPIMATGGAVTIAGAGTRHVLIGQIDLKVAVGIAIGGVPAVFVAAFLVREMSLEMLRWLVTVVVLYASAVMFHAARGGHRASREELLAAGETG